MKQLLFFACLLTAINAFPAGKRAEHAEREVKRRMATAYSIDQWSPTQQSSLQAFGINSMEQVQFLMQMAAQGIDPTQAILLAQQELDFRAVIEAGTLSETLRHIITNPRCSHFITSHQQKAFSVLLGNPDFCKRFNNMPIYNYFDQLREHNPDTTFAPGAVIVRAAETIVLGFKAKENNKQFNALLQIPAQSLTAPVNSNRKKVYQAIEQAHSILLAKLKNPANVSDQNAAAALDSLAVYAQQLPLAQRRIIQWDMGQFYGYDPKNFHRLLVLRAQQVQATSFPQAAQDLIARARAQRAQESPAAAAAAAALGAKLATHPG
jgi:hypothetical protein